MRSERDKNLNDWQQSSLSLPQEAGYDGLEHLRTLNSAFRWDEPQGDVTENVAERFETMRRLRYELERRHHDAMSSDHARPVSDWLHASEIEDRADRILRQYKLAEAGGVMVNDEQKPLMREMEVNSWRRYEAEISRLGSALHRETWVDDEFNGSRCIVDREEEIGMVKTDVDRYQIWLQARLDAVRNAESWLDGQRALTNQAQFIQNIESSIKCIQNTTEASQAMPADARMYFAPADELLDMGRRDAYHKLTQIYNEVYGTDAPI